MTPLPPAALERTILARKGLRFFVWLLLGLLAHGSSPALAQGRFNANTYYGQCLRFEAGGDLETARQSCLNALSLDPRLQDAALALARIDTALGNLSEAETRLGGLVGLSNNAEPYLLLAEIALRGERHTEAQGFLEAAALRLGERYNRALEGRRNFLAGRLAEAQGEVGAALQHYGAAVRADGLQASYRLSEAGLRYRLGDLGGAAASLSSFEALSGERNPEVYSLLGHVAWAMSDPLSAADNLETAIILRGSSEREATQRDLRDLALIYYGQGKLQNGNEALRGAGSPFASSQTLLWLLLLAALLALHLVGESRVASGSSLELGGGPELWTVGQVYGTLLGALLAAGAGAVLYGALRFDNPLAFATPVQGGEAEAVFFALLAVALLGSALWRVRQNGWRPLETLMGNAGGRARGGAGTGVGAGALLLALVLAAQTYAPWQPFWGFYLDLSRLTLPLLAAVVLMPLSALYFRAFVIPPLAERYTPLIGTLLSGILYALVLGAPLALTLIVGLLLAGVYRRTRNGLAPLLAQYVLHLGLLVGVAFSPWVRSLFL